MRGAADEHRQELPREDAEAETAADLVLGELAGLEVVLEQRVVGLGDGFEKAVAVLGRRRLEIGRDRAGLRGGEVARRGQRLHRHEVDVALQARRDADRDRDRHDLRVDDPRDRRQRLAEIGLLAVETAHVGDGGNAELAAPLPDALELDLHLAVWGEHEDRARHRREGGAGFGEERGVAGRVDDRELVLPPRHVMDRRADGRLAADLLGLDVEERGPVVGAAEAGRAARGQDHRVGEQGLADPALPDDADVADPCNLFGSHAILPATVAARYWLRR